MKMHKYINVIFQDLRNNTDFKLIFKLQEKIILNKRKIQITDQNKYVE